MKKLFPLSMAALLVAACTESPLPTTPMLPSAPRLDVGIATGQTYNFELGAADLTPFSPATVNEIPADDYLRGQKGYLGPFRNQTVSMVSENLAGGHLNFDLYIEGSWDGNANGRFGGDVWTISATCGDAVNPVVSFSTNFRNKADKTTQAYPQRINVGKNPGLTGAHFLDQLGFAPEEVKKTNKSVSTYDAVYPMSWPFPNCGSAETVTWKFSGAGIDQAEDEFWGLDNISVTTVQAADLHYPHLW